MRCTVCTGADIGCISRKINSSEVEKCKLLETVPGPKHHHPLIIVSPPSPSLREDSSLLVETHSWRLMACGSYSGQHVPCHPLFRFSTSNTLIQLKHITNKQSCRSSKGAMMPTVPPIFLSSLTSRRYNTVLLQPSHFSVTEMQVVKQALASAPSSPWQKPSATTDVISSPDQPLEHCTVCDMGPYINPTRHQGATHPSQAKARRLVELLGKTSTEKERLLSGIARIT